MSKLRITLFLPLFQVALAAGLLAWGHKVPDPKRLDTPYVPTVILISHGINAPALLLRPLALLVPGREVVETRLRQTVGFGLDEIIFLIAIAALWHLVAKRLPVRHKPLIPGDTPKRMWLIAWHLLLLAVGVFLFVSAFSLVRSPGQWNNKAGSIVEAILFFCWSITLTVTSSLSLTQMSRRGRNKANAA